jgi:hypothetical protein
LNVLPIINPLDRLPVPPGLLRFPRLRPQENRNRLSALNEESVAAARRGAHHFARDGDVRPNRQVLWPARRHTNPQVPHRLTGFGAVG